MFSALADLRSFTPVAQPAGMRNQPGRRSQVLSVTRQVPSPVDAMSYRQCATGTIALRTSNANTRPGSASVTVHAVDQDLVPALLVPLNLAPGAAVSPCSHSIAVVSAAT